MINDINTPTIALIGRSNVGKSTLFNWIAQHNFAIINKTPNTTRDRNYKSVYFADNKYTLIDTGGLCFNSKNLMNKNIIKQTYLAINEAHLILFIVDAKDGLLPQDIVIANKLRKINKHIIITINKCDSKKIIEQKTYQFYSLMKAPIYNISATQGLGIKSLFNKIELLLNNSTKIKLDNNNYIKNNFFAANKQINTKKIKIAVIGKPNVGKSSFLNKLSNKNRHLISNKPGTTRDMIDSLITYKNKNYLFIDTAGIKKKRNINNLIDKQSITTTLKSLDRCMLALLLIDIKKGITDQDLKIASFVQKKAKGMIIIVNKCDLISLNKTSQNIYSKQIKAIMPFFYFAPICFISSLTGKNIFETIKDINIVFNNYFKKISTSKLNNFLKIITKIHKPPIINGTQLKLSYIVQSSIAPPIFIITCNQPKKIHFSYSRYILNKLHKHFSFTGVPLKIIYKNKKIVKLNCYEYNKIKL